jgi:hypothetical protein
MRRDSACDEVLLGSDSGLIQRKVSRKRLSQTQIIYTAGVVAHIATKFPMSDLCKKSMYIADVLDFLQEAHREATKPLQLQRLTIL